MQRLLWTEPSPGLTMLQVNNIVSPDISAERWSYIVVVFVADFTMTRGFARAA